MIYKVKIGYDVPTVNLDPVAPQPKSDGVRATQRMHTGNGLIFEQGLYVELVFGALGTVAQYQALLGQFNLSTFNVAPVTIAVRSERLVTTRYNGTAVRPDLGNDAHWSFMPRDVVILIKNLEALVG